jgi:GTP-binding protein
MDGEVASDVKVYTFDEKEEDIQVINRGNGR